MPPLQQVGKFGPFAELGFPHRDDLKTVSGSHDRSRMIAKAGVERGLVLFEDLVNAQLLDHGHFPFDPEIWSDYCFSNPPRRVRKDIRIPSGSSEAARHSCAAPLDFKSPPPSARIPRPPSTASPCACPTPWPWHSPRCRRESARRYPA